ncbi:hypothetical protein QBC42DRAFT_319392 [Cladorrhinum samala]|uniref:Uncharacterized protein n=1 Tax=Cladorrhinum samala TaxID=585594 RepID=A0AAV9HWY3_9PEZI|nr:hypothetical protein QBC42DRAFT_319392 [Cladorrhinum samala]
MGRYFITGSSDGLGLLTAKKLVAQGHSVVLHARNAQRAKDASAALPGAEAVLTADLSSIDETKSLASQADRLGPYDAVVHNAGVYTDPGRAPGSGFSTLFTVNVLAPWILTCSMAAPKRLVYVSSCLHRSGSIETVTRDIAKSNYGDSKLVMVMLAKAVANREWQRGGTDPSELSESTRRRAATTRVEAYSVDPGWVPTKMGGPSASGDLEAGVDSFVKLALGPRRRAGVVGRGEEGPGQWAAGGYFFGGEEEAPKQGAEDRGSQRAVLDQLKELTGLGLPG